MVILAAFIPISLSASATEAAEPSFSPIDLSLMHYARSKDIYTCEPDLTPPVLTYGQMTIPLNTSGVNNSLCFAGKPQQSSLFEMLYNYGAILELYDNCDIYSALDIKIDRCSFDCNDLKGASIKITITDTSKNTDSWIVDVVVKDGFEICMESEGEGEGETIDEGEGEGESIPEGENEGEGESPVEGENEGEGENVREGEGEGESVREGEGEGENEGEGESVREGEGEGENEGELAVEGEDLSEGEETAEGEICLICSAYREQYTALAGIIGLAYGILWLAEDPPSPCMVASAAYGTPMTGEIALLRLFRDTWLLESPVGTAFVDVYYRGGGIIAAYVSDHTWAAQTVRVLLYPVLLSVILALFAPGLFYGLLLFLSGMLVGGIYFIKRRASRRKTPSPFEP